MLKDLLSCWNAQALALLLPRRESKVCNSRWAGGADTVLLDLSLPDISGYEVCRQLRTEPKAANVAVISHTAASSLGIEHLADAFLTYPVETGHICFVIEGCVARRRSALT